MIPILIPVNALILAFLLWFAPKVWDIRIATYWVVVGPMLLVIFFILVRVVNVPFLSDCVFTCKED